VERDTGETTEVEIVRLGATIMIDKTAYTVQVINKNIGESIMTTTNPELKNPYFTLAKNGAKSSHFVDITPGLAAAFLTLNTKTEQKNRGSGIGSKKRIADYVEQIKTGHFMTTHQGIAFSDSGVLLDGQHRLYAIEQSGVTVKMLVTTGQPEQTFSVIDVGMKRSTSTLTGLDRRVSAVCRFLVFAATGAHSGHCPSHKVLAVAESGIAEIVNEITASPAHKRKPFISMAGMTSAAVLLIYDGKDKEYIKHLYKSLVLSDFDAMPEIAKAFIKRQLEKNKNQNINAITQLTIGCKLYNPINRDNRRFMITESDKYATMELLADRILPLISADGVTATSKECRS
jgi:hypothetical protein